MPILFNIKNKLIEIIDEKYVINNLYYFIHRPITNNDIKDYQKNDKINDIINENKNIVNDMKIQISKIEDKVPLYDIYSNNIILIGKYNVYERIVNQYYRFPEQELLDELKKKREVIINDTKDIKMSDIDPLIERDIQKIDQMLQFMSYFDLDILYDTYIKVFYKYSKFAGREITPCRKPSFLPQFYHIRPYFTRDEIINIAMNIGLDVCDELDYKEIKRKYNVS